MILCFGGRGVLNLTQVGLASQSVTWHTQAAKWRTLCLEELSMLKLMNLEGIPDSSTWIKKLKILRQRKGVAGERAHTIKTVQKRRLSHRRAFSYNILKKLSKIMFLKSPQLKNWKLKATKLKQLKLDLGLKKAWTIFSPLIENCRDFPLKMYV